ncbi:hypothetical protein HK101_003156 [Irineochytrium annulatum]|nr:hypothetical protein HK101_003156 [Irineochytrium annulatum]
MSRRQSRAFTDQIAEEDEEALAGDATTDGDPATDNDADNAEDDEEDDEYDESMFVKYQEQLGGRSVRSSAMGQGGALSRRSTQGNWSLRRRMSNFSSGGGSTGGIMSRGSGGGGGGAADGGVAPGPITARSTQTRRASFVANMSLLPIALRKLQLSNTTSSFSSQSSGNATAINSPNGVASPRGMDGVGGSRDDMESSKKSLNWKGRKQLNEDKRNATFLSALGVDPNDRPPASPDSEDAGADGDEGMQFQSMGRRDTMAVSRIFERKRIFLQLSLIFGFSSLGIVIYEYICILIFETPSNTATWLVSLLLVQVGSFYLFVLAFIYANEAVVNLLGLIMRAVLQFNYTGYFPRGIEGRLVS